MSRYPTRIQPGLRWPLLGCARLREWEGILQAELAPHTLMGRAGHAVAQLAQALYPHAQRIWVACGPGNNGGDGLVAAAALQAAGRHVHLTWLGDPTHAPADTQWAWAQAQDVPLCTDCPESADLVIDALLGLGQNRPPEGPCAAHLEHLHALAVPVLHVDVPTGLDPETGVWHGPALAPVPRHTLALLAPTPGLFTAQGRDASGEVWWDDLGGAQTPSGPTTLAHPEAWLITGVTPAPARPHVSHKGLFGDVAVVGGATGMTGAASLAALAALRGGAGRVYLALLAPEGRWDPALNPALMTRACEALDLPQCHVVCGCGGGEAVRAHLPRLISQSQSLVLDADALNALAQEPALVTRLQARAGRQRATVLTPHPLEAARLLGCSVREVQHNRLASAQALAQRYAAIVVLKGSGTVCAAQDHTPEIHHGGHPRLATAGSGDVLAGLIGAQLAQGHAPWLATQRAVALHGRLAAQWDPHAPFDASALALAITRD